ncbi:hypothetical protein [Streptomyces sp. TRM49041]|uniref:hypothetical protein n=1 Tax=Streptomyces sp. TRM49041 TaxID=2603216 RepID=UPI0011F075CD|nr:hypothetical protein [Streptomyces sp. TRM49041]
MTTLLSELGKKLAERWVALLVLPGLLYVGVAGAALRLGHSQALDVGELGRWITARASDPASHNAGVIVLLLAATLIAAAGAGLAAAALGRLVHGLWTLSGSRPPLRVLARWRKRRWEKASRRIGEAMGAVLSRPGPVPQAELRSAVRARDRVCPVPPTHASWIGDRLGSADFRCREAYDLDLAAAWPRLWLVVAEETRKELVTAHDAYSAATRLMGWAALYAPLAVLWWPAAAITLVVAATAQVRGRGAAAVLADLTEATVDLYGAELAGRLGIVHSGDLTQEVGAAITDRTRKDQLTLSHAEPVPLSRRAR